MPGVSIVLHLESRGFGRGLRNAGGQVAGFGRRVANTMRSAGAAIRRAAGAALDRISTPAALGSAFGIGAASRELLDIERRLDALRVNGDASAETILRLEQQLRDLSGLRTGQTIDQLLTAAESLVAKDSAFLQELAMGDGLEQLGRAATATGADIRDLSETYFQLRQSFGLAHSEAIDGIAVLHNLGKRGDFTLPSLARELPQIGGMFQAIGQDGTRGLTRAGAALLAIRRNVASAGEASTQLRNFVSFIQSEAGSRRLGQRGIQVFDPQTGEMNDLFDLIAQIREVTDGGRNAQVLSSIFSDQGSASAVRALIQHYEFLQDTIQSAEAASTSADFAIITEGNLQRFQALRAELLKIAQLNLAPWLDRFGKLAEALAERPALLEGLIKGGLALGGLAVARRSVGFLRGAAGAAAGGASPAGILAGGLGMGVTPVRVVNWPGGVLGGAGGDIAGSAAGATITGAATGGQGPLGRLLGAGAAGIGGLMTRLGMGQLAATGAGAAALTSKAGLAAAAPWAVAGGAAGYGIGSLVNRFLIPDTWKRIIQDAFASALAATGNEAAGNLVRQNRAERERRLLLEVMPSEDFLVRELRGAP